MFILRTLGTSDHLPVFVCRKYTKLNKDASHKVINYHVFKNLNPENLLDDLKMSLGIVLLITPVTAIQ
jgi:hypothetical protein